MARNVIALVLMAVAVTVLGQSSTGIATTYGGPEGSPPGDGNCNLMDWLPMSTNGYHVAINTVQWALGKHCGRCVQIQCVDSGCTTNAVAVAQITDHCPGCENGDLDMALPIFQATTGHTTGRWKVQWSFVDCPVQGGVKICAKVGSSQWWLAVQPTNTVNGVASMSVNGPTCPLFGGTAYYFQAQQTAPLGSTQISMTSFSGDTITANVALQPGQCTQLTQQFKTGGASPPNPQPNPQPQPQPAPQPAPASVPVAPMSVASRLQLPLTLTTSTSKGILEYYSGIYMGDNTYSSNFVWTYNAGTQQLQSRSAPNQCLDAYRGGDGNMYLHTWTCDASNSNQKWIVSGSSVKHATHNNLCVDANPSTANNAVQVWPCVLGNSNQMIAVASVMLHVGISLRSQNVVFAANQDSSVSFRPPSPSFNALASDQGALWTFDHMQNTIKSELTGLCLDAYLGSNGAPVHTYSCSLSNGNQQWQYDPSSKAIKHMIYKGFCLDMDLGSKKAQLWQCNGGASQQFGYEK
ncbi:hypothetical protein SDRG_08083 [Saprolegnia diclina VS20]|uniref:Expansin-like EG45 domain-containing protein n=1 Tax=Saprolegnia diclina (strain VS20) TaxID=1156394 RepID=T0QKI7_SAPDV|nr:hypothetical protein SDRG_08083 [Saprolegnia diclina VS20]EQC34310.1 hypothetical protein SDRG_08083 [Saprolegnia diclina VS20]|eukprot:XP_008612172.1 hypothetical protein SDRG_08083 [Saprolegnia diclina VS20]